MNVPQERLYPLSMPKGDYVPPVQRYALKLPEEITDLHTVYIGVQHHGSKSDASDSSSVTSSAYKSITEWIESSPQPPIYESFEVISGYDVQETRVWVTYYTSTSAYNTHAAQLDLAQLHARLGESKNSIGLWREHFHTPVAQLETNYSGNDYAPGLAQIPGSAQLPHKYSAYWGAARDRIPASATDAFEQPAAAVMGNGLGAAHVDNNDDNNNDNNDNDDDVASESLGKHLKGAIGFDNIVHIRTGQFWQRCGAEERAAYEQDLERTLLTGLAYLHDNPAASGNLGLRFLRNVRSTIDDARASQPKPEHEHAPTDEPTEPRREICAAGFFRNLADLEQWTKRHKSHLAIYNGAHRHAKRFAGDGRMRTWHEVSVLKRGQAGFEYVNCVRDTGGVRFVSLETQ